MNSYTRMMVIMIFCCIFVACLPADSEVLEESVEPSPISDDNSSYPARPTPLPDSPPLPTPIIGPACTVVRNQNHSNTVYSYELLDGWQSHYTGIINFDFDSLEFKHGYAKKPAGAVRLTLSVLQLDKDRSIEDLVASELASEKQNQEFMDAQFEPEFEVDSHQYEEQRSSYPVVERVEAFKLPEEIVSVNIGSMQGYIQRLELLAYSGWQDSGHLRLWLLNEDNYYVRANIEPIDSANFSDAVKILESMRFGQEAKCNTSIKNTHRGKVTHLETDNLFQYTCPHGTFPGNEAPSVSGQLILEMPFRKGQSWIPGGHASFYGNNFHCNFYNNYYAVDWNQPSNDVMKEVFASAEGVVTDLDAYWYIDANGNEYQNCSRDPNNRYGCFVQIDHSNGFRTLYAHLLDTSVFLGQQIKKGQLIGWVGSTGNSIDPHLHLSFWKNSWSGFSSKCYNNSQNCPNGEAPQSPQGYKPSPMKTQFGNALLVDGRSYVSQNLPTQQHVYQHVYWSPTNCITYVNQLDEFGFPIWSGAGSFEYPCERGQVPSGNGPIESYTSFISGGYLREAMWRDGLGYTRETEINGGGYVNWNSTSGWVY